MSAIANGIALHSPASSPTAPPSSSSPTTCALPRTRLLQRATLFVMTHDSIGVGEDGPDQPIEHLASFRAMPGML